MGYHTGAMWRSERYPDSENNYMLVGIEIDAGDDGRPRAFQRSIIEGSLVSENPDADARLIESAPELLAILQMVLRVKPTGDGFVNLSPRQRAIIADIYYRVAGTHEIP